MTEDDETAVQRQKKKNLYMFIPAGGPGLVN
jgi:hypothetical protein